MGFETDFFLHLAWNSLMSDTISDIHGIEACLMTNQGIVNGANTIAKSV